MKLEAYQILALDVGHKRIGVARAGSQARLSQPLEIVATTNEGRLLELIEQYQPQVLVVGLPYIRAGGLGQQAEFIQNWVNDFVTRHRLKITIIYQDETLSSQAVEHISSNKQARHKDDLAAELILSDYLETLNKS